MSTAQELESLLSTLEMVVVVALSYLTLVLGNSQWKRSEKGMADTKIPEAMSRLLRKGFFLER